MSPETWRFTALLKKDRPNVNAESIAMPIPAITVNERVEADANAFSDTSRKFTELKPKLKQVFFIGDGSTKDGRKQNFIAPKGTTRLFLATWDFYEWNNNAGYREVKVSRPQQVITVK